MSFLRLTRLIRFCFVQTITKLSSETAQVDCSTLSRMQLGRQSRVVIPTKRLRLSVARSYLLRQRHLRRVTRQSIAASAYFTSLSFSSNLTIASVSCPQ